MADKNFVIRDGVEVTETVIASIAGLAALEAEGINTLNGGITANTLPKAGANKVARAIRVVRNEDSSISIQMIVSVKYGYSILKVTEHVQEKVKTSVESMTDITVKNVDVKVSSVDVKNMNA
ncbi:MAG: Asp23/Gls24 family envelope stress response protein [Lachnospiraceae bacterium]|nr:Asp23/Gls24 family envelope stress response protein [Lachnospiraceae bacterium]